MVDNLLKSLVSKKKKRHVEGRFNLDLSFITPRIMAMGYPAERLEAIYRNDAQDVLDFFNEHFTEHYYVFNLCCERTYDAALFGGRVENFPMQDHNPPPLQMISAFCRRINEILNADKRNVVAVHCKAGKGRTGVMICSYLMHSDLAVGPQAALEMYGRKRTRDGHGVTIPSQQRYVRYYHRLLCAQRAAAPGIGDRYEPVRLRLLRLEVRQGRSWEGHVQAGVFGRYPLQEDGRGGGDERPLAESAAVAVQREDNVVTLPLCGGVLAAGDVKLELWSRSRLRPRERICQVWFNTWFVARSERIGSGGSGRARGGSRDGSGAKDRVESLGVVKWYKSDMDMACSDRRVPQNAELWLYFRSEQPPPGQVSPRPPTS